MSSCSVPGNVRNVAILNGGPDQARHSLAMTIPPIFFSRPVSTVSKAEKSFCVFEFQSNVADEVWNQSIASGKRGRVTEPASWVISCFTTVDGNEYS